MRRKKILKTKHFKELNETLKSAKKKELKSDSRHKQYSNRQAWKTNNILVRSKFKEI